MGELVKSSTADEAGSQGIASTNKNVLSVVPTVLNAGVQELPPPVPEADQPKEKKSVKKHRRKSNAVLEQEPDQPAQASVAVPVPAASVISPEPERVEDVDANPPKKKLKSTGSTANAKPNRKKRNKPVALDEPELVAAKSEKLWTSIKETAGNILFQPSLNEDVQSQDQNDAFDTCKPVSLPNFADDEELSRCIDYVRLDLQSFQNMIKQRPLDKDKVILKIEANIKWWQKLIQSPPPEIKQLMDGFHALKEALTTDPQSLAASLISKRTQLDSKVAAIKKAQDTVSAACASMTEITACFEEQLEYRELQMQQRLTLIQELKSQIQQLRSRLELAGEAHTQESGSRDQEARCLKQHEERLKEANDLQSQLERASKQGQDQARSLAQAIGRFTDQDSSGLTAHAQSLFQFFLACSSDP
ncbi:hypothetical protein BS78_06G264500 [Paspalum vaginatum]|nr:hypothetical protein BS78_06G264500 [Paspalum vaginatum]